MIRNNSQDNSIKPEDRIISAINEGNLALIKAINEGNQLLLYAIQQGNSIKLNSNNQLLNAINELRQKKIK